MRLFIDQRYPGEIVSEDQLRREYCEKLENEEIDGTFNQYVWNCLESQGGTLKEIISA